ncbi:hypodermin-B-like [Vanessa atalanta]|uniref:hypodermin-B-like n=1 Tax=Vanessa atalanta TaxID=42275 RepID=UPI001FCD0AEB|nr:hypodermin-B-like [Vanessa atalanta]
MIAIAYLILFWPAGSFGQGDRYNGTKEDSNATLFEVTGYPLTGDIPLLNRKIFRGSRVNIREHPYIVSIRRNNCHYLTGTLITKNLVLTVAHPIIGVPIQHLKIVAGENYSDRGTSLLTVILVVVHQNFDPFTLNADLAMLRFYEDVIFKSSIKSISLIMPHKPFFDSDAFVTGWGRCDLTDKELCLPRSSDWFPDERMDPMLRTVSFHIDRENFYCDGYKQHDTKVRPGMLCLGPAREEKPSFACLAVPGAPLVVKAKLAGILSWGFGCGYLHDLPLLYTSVQYYTMWIAQNIISFRKLSMQNFSQLFQATKSFIILEWLVKNRVSKPPYHQHGVSYRELQMLELDRELSKIQGDLYDIRDFINKEELHSKKQLMYRVIKEEQIKNKTKNMEKIVLMQQLKIKTYPFISNKTLIDINIKYDDYNNSDDD